MKKILPLILLGIFVSGSGRAQISGVDTLFRAEDLIYFSALEEQAFRDFRAGKPDYMAMIAAINPDTDQRELELYRAWVDEMIIIIREKKFDGLSDEKKIERIRKYVSQTLLHSYKHGAGFDELFRFGYFNYLTAAAIYSFILDKSGIPYEIYEDPARLYMVAFPENQKIRIEISEPGQQFFRLDHEVRVNFVDFIHLQGVIDDRTYQNNGIKELFQQYYFASYGLSIQDMIGMLYLNSAIQMLAHENTDEAYCRLEKAYILHPSYKSQYMLLLQLNTYLSSMDYHNPLSLGYLIKASRLIDFGITRERIENFLSDIVHTVLVTEEDRDGFMFIYDYLMTYLRDKKLRDDFTFQYLYESGRMEFNDTKYGKALDFLEQAHQLKPDHEKTRNLLARSLAGYSLVVSPALVLDKIHLYDSSYAAIREETIYMLVKVQTFLELFGEAFQLQDGNTGEFYLKEFEKSYDENPDLGIDQFQIGRSYSSAAIYYYRNARVSKSREVIEKGLRYAPDNVELKLKLNAFK